MYISSVGPWTLNLFSRFIILHAIPDKLSTTVTKEYYITMY